PGAPQLHPGGTVGGIAWHLQLALARAEAESLEYHVGGAARLRRECRTTARAAEEFLAPAARLGLREGHARERRRRRAIIGDGEALRRRIAADDPLPEAHRCRAHAHEGARVGDDVGAERDRARATWRIADHRERAVE